MINGCDVKGKDNLNRQPLHFAAFKGHTDVVRKLITYDVSVINEVDNVGWTALHYAAINNDQQVVELLLQQPSVDVNMKDDYGLMADEMGTDHVIRKMIRNHREKTS